MLECKLLKPEERLDAQSHPIGPIEGATRVTWAAGLRGLSSLSFPVMLKQVLQNLNVPWMVENACDVSL